MPEETITIGGKSFVVACQDGEEDYLRAAAAMLDAEARTLIDQIGRLPESRMLLMSGLMLADKTAGAEDRARTAEAALAEAQAEIARLRAAPAVSGAGAKPDLSTLSALADRAEELADKIEQSS